MIFDDDLIGNVPDSRPAPSEADVSGGVTARWLANVFRLPEDRVKKKLATVRSLGGAYARYRVYDLAEAASVLVTPKGDIAEYIRTAPPGSLPSKVEKDFWDAHKSRLAVLKQSGELWPTDRVFEVFADTFKAIKDAMLLWPDQLARTEGLTPEQHTAVTKLFDSFQEQLHANLIELPKQKQTQSQTEVELRDAGEIDDLRPEE